MKKIILALPFVWLFQPAAQAMQFISRTDLTLDQGQHVAEDLYLAGEKVAFLGTADRDLCLAASSRATVSGYVGRELNVAAVSAEISGAIGDNLRVLASEVAVSSLVGGSTILIASDVVIKPECRLRGDVLILGEDVRVSGVIQDKLTIRAAKVLIDGTVLGALHIEADSIEFGRQAKVLGQVGYVSKQEARVNSNAVVSSQPLRQEPTPTPASSGKSGWKKFLSVGKIFLWLTLVLGMATLGIFGVAVFPAATRRLAQVLRYRLFPSLGWGILTALGALLLMLLLTVSVVGIPLAMVLGILLLANMVAAAIGAGYMLGMLVLRPKTTASGINLGAFLLGFAGLCLIGFIPVLGAVVWCVIFLAGFGAIWLFKNFVEPNSPLPATAGLPVQHQRTQPQAPAPLPKAAKPQAHRPAAGPKPAEAEWKPEVPAFKRKTKATTIPKKSKSNIKTAGKKAKQVKKK